MPKLESVLKIRMDQPTQAQRLTSPGEFGRTPRKTPKPVISPEDFRQLSQDAEHG